MKSVLIFATIILPSLSFPHYYWREFDGHIPADAVVVGKSLNGNNVYVGQALVDNPAVVKLGKIYPGVNKMQVAHHKVITIDKFMKILCGPQENFYWLTVEKANVNVALLDKHPVIGGYEMSIGIIHIGRISVEGETEIGKVHSDGTMIYIHNNAMGVPNNYQILMYREDDVNTY